MRAITALALSLTLATPAAGTPLHEAARAGGAASPLRNGLPAAPHGSRLRSPRSLALRTENGNTHRAPMGSATPCSSSARRPSPS